MNSTNRNIDIETVIHLENNTKKKIRFIIPLPYTTSDRVIWVPLYDVITIKREKSSPVLYYRDRGVDKIRANGGKRDD